MATQQSTSRSSKNTSTRSSQRGDARKQSKASGATAERDETYGLISVVYHALQGAETCEQYADDARRAGNEELTSFFDDCREEQKRRALEGRRLLAAEFRDLEDDVEEMIDEGDS